MNEFIKIIHKSYTFKFKVNPKITFVVKASECSVFFYVHLVIGEKSKLKLQIDLIHFLDFILYEEYGGPKLCFSLFFFTR